MSKEPHLNLQPSPNWGIPFGISVFLSMMALLTFYELFESNLSSYTVGENCATAFFTAFFMTILTGFWVAVRGSNRKFYSSMCVRVSIVGLLCPVVIVCIGAFLEYIEYGTPTLASPRTLIFGMKLGFSIRILL